MDIHNRTDWSLEQVRQFPVLKTGRNNWRQRNIVLYQHPDKPEHVVSVGVTFDGSMCVICDETKKDWSRELSAPGGFVTN